MTPRYRDYAKMPPRRGNRDWEAYLPNEATIRLTGYVKQFYDARREHRFRTLYQDGMTIGEYLDEGMRLGLGNNRNYLRRDIRHDCDPKHCRGYAMIEIWLPDGTKVDPETLPKL